MAIVDIIELIKPETGEKFYPSTTLSAVRGNDTLPRFGSVVQSTLPLAISQLVDSSNTQFYPQTHAEAVIGLSQMIEDNQFFVKVQDSQDPTKFSIKLKDEYTGLWSNGWIADGGIGTGGGGGGGGSSTLYGLNDVSIPQPPSAPSTNDILSYSTSLGKWTNVAKATFLSGYAEQSWVQSWVQQQGYLLPSALNPYALSSSLATVATTGNYSDLNGLPTIPSAPGTLVTNNSTAQTASSGESLSVTINLHKIAKTGNYGDLIDRPTNVSAFNNDAGYLTSFTETDPTVPSWAKATSKPSYSLSEISGTDDLQLIEALTGGGLLRRNANNTWSLDSSSYALASDLTALTGRVTSIEDWFEVVTINGQSALHVKQGRALYSDSWIADGGIGSGGGGGGTYVAWGTKVGYTRPLTVEGVTETLLLEGALSSYATTSDLNAGLASKQNVIDAQHKLDYDLLTNTPTIPDAQINSDWNAESGVSQILNKPSALPNPSKLTFGNKEYDGSSAVSLSASDLGAVTSVSLSAGATTGTLKLTVNGTDGSDVPIPDLSGTYLKYFGWAGTGFDFNDALFGSWMYSDSPTHCPSSAGGGQLLALGSASTSYQYGMAQVAIGTNGVPYFRLRWGGSWVDWREALVSGVSQTIAGAKTFSNDMTLGGTLTLSGSTKKIAFGSFYIELQDLGSGNYALHTNAPFYSDQWIADGGIGSGGGGGGSSTLRGLDDVDVPVNPGTNDILSYNGSMWVNVSKSNFLSGYATTSALAGKQDLIDASHKLSYNLLTDTPTIPTVPANVSAFTNDAGYITSSALSDYVPTTRKVNNHPLSSDVTVTASDVGLGNVTNLAASGYFTAFEMGTGTDANKTKITVGGTTKSLTIGYATNAGTLDGTAKGSLFSALTNDNNQISITIGGTTKKLTVDYAGTAGSASRLSGNTAYSIWGVEYWASGVPKSVTAQPTLYIGKTRVKTSDSSNDTLIGIDGFTYAASASASNDSSKVYWDANAGGTGVGAWHFKGNIVADGWIADGGIGSGSGGNAGTLADLNDVTLSSLANGDVLTYNSSSNHWVNTAKATFLSGYATQTWVGNQGYLTSSALSGYATQNWVGQQGYITGSLTANTNDYTLAIGSASADLYSTSQIDALLADLALVNGDLNEPFSVSKLTFKTGGSGGPSTQGLWANGDLTLTDDKKLQVSYKSTSVNPLGGGYSTSTVTKTVAYTSDVPSIYSLTLSAGAFTAGTYNPTTSTGNAFSIPTTLDHIADGTNRKYSDFVHITGAETISGAKTFSGGVTVSGNNLTITGAYIVPGADDTNKIGNSGARFNEGHIRNVYTSYFQFRDGTTETPTGQISFGSGYGQFTTLGTNGKNYMFYNDKLFVQQNGRLSAVVDLGTRDHRWKAIYGIDSDFNGTITLRQPIDESTNGTIIGSITGSAGYLDFTAGTGGSAKHIYFHPSYGFYPSQSGVALGGDSAATRWSTIYGVDENLSGNLKLSGTTKKIYFGDTYYIELVDLGSGQNPRYALHTNAPLYSDFWIADGGIQQTS